MKNILILSLLIVIALLAFGTRNEAQPVIEDTTLHHASYAVSCQPLMPIQPLKPKLSPFGRKPDAA